MGRRCHCDKLFRQLEEDVRLRTLPMAAQMLWLRLMRLAATTPGFDGVLRFGSEFGFLVSVSLAVSCAETEVETALGALQRRGLVERTEDGEGLRLPDAEAAATRSEAARINGLRGGRPRKGEGAEAYRARRQGTLMLPIAGGAGETQETQIEPIPESSRAAAKPIAIEAKQAEARETPEWVSLGLELCTLAKLDPARGHHTVLPVKGWIDAGASPDMLRQLIRERAARPGYSAKSLNWFHQAVCEAIKRGTPAAPIETSGYEREVMAVWERNGRHGIPMSAAEWRASKQSAA